METKKWDIDCVIYDCDGVLFDSFEQNRMLYNYIAQSQGRAPLTDEEAHYCHAHTVYESIHYVFKDTSDKEEGAVAFWKSSINFMDFIVYLKMEPHLTETLAALKERGVKLAISTNRTTTMKHIMEAFGLNKWFDMVVTALDVENPKPHPESVEKILDVMKMDRERVLYVGDSEVDRGTARAAGVKFIAYKNQGLEADGAIDEHLDLLRFLADG
ncbi:MAG TPA: HAD-IA family hydrolase [Syntrophorhabdaceae bacterium]|nr:HAD-IA family hydrolase [Syntrophorhabdaceae bacterium]